MSKPRSKEVDIIDSKFDPDPLAVATPAAKAKEISKPAPEAKIPDKVHEFKEDKTFLFLTDRYKIKLKPESGYRAFLRLIAKEGHFAEVAKKLSEGINVSDLATCQSLLDKMMVRRDAIEQMLRTDDRWAIHTRTRMNRLQKRVMDSDNKSSSQAKAIIANRKRVKDGKWVGDIQEIISTCCGAWKNGNRNVKKFDDGGIAFRKFPLKATRDQPVYLMMFPSEYAETVIKMLQTVYPDLAKDEEIPEKYVINTE